MRGAHQLHHALDLAGLQRHAHAPSDATRSRTPMQSARRTYGPRLGPLHVVQAEAVDALDERHVLEARGGQVEGARAAALEQAVGRDRGAEDEQRDVVRRRRARPRARSNTASTGWAGVDGTLTVRRSPVASSRATRSVNVPPVSTPMRSCCWAFTARASLAPSPTGAGAEGGVSAGGEGVGYRKTTLATRWGRRRRRWRSRTRRGRSASTDRRADRRPPGRPVEARPRSRTGARGGREATPRARGALRCRPLR